jgi:hypothetical protein
MRAGGNGRPVSVEGVSVDWAKAILNAQLVRAAEAISPSEVYGPAIRVASGGEVREYAVLATLFGNDLATDGNPGRREMIVSFGFIAQSEAGDVVVAFRGTQGIHEWLRDCLYHLVPCPFLAGAGHTEDGFTAIYQSLRVGAEHGAQRLREAFVAMEFPRSVRSLTVAGHSLGAALATLFALDLAGNTVYKNPEVFTFASPRTGDERFAKVFNELVPKTFRIANRMDVITEVPPVWLSHATPYRHVEATTVLVPGLDLGHQHIVCMHCLTTYVYLMMKQAAGADVVTHECCGSRGSHKDLLVDILRV